MINHKVAVVTGSNKGIGLAIVRSLCQKFDGHVYLTSRSVERGVAAVEFLQSEGLSPKFHQLDIDDVGSIEKFKDYLLGEYGGLDVLINNAGIAFKVKDEAPFGVQAEETVKTNYFGTLNVSSVLLPIVRRGGRVVNVSSLISASSIKKCSSDLQDLFRSASITEEQLSHKMREFVQHAKQGTHGDAGFPPSAYGVSKIGVTVLTRVHARRLTEEGGKDVLVNCCCPGRVRTDMSTPSSPKSPDEGAETPVYLALLPPGAKDPHGQYLSDKTVQPW